MAEIGILTEIGVFAGMEALTKTDRSLAESVIRVLVCGRSWGLVKFWPNGGKDKKQDMEKN